MQLAADGVQRKLFFDTRFVVARLFSIVHGVGVVGERFVGICRRL
jgi:hypothetical protein